MVHTWDVGESDPFFCERFVLPIPSSLTNDGIQLVALLGTHGRSSRIYFNDATQ